jgi:hypothetical protein
MSAQRVSTSHYPILHPSKAIQQTLNQPALSTRESEKQQTNKQLSSADFWGPISNFGIPVAAVLDTQKSPELYVAPIAPRSFPASKYVTNHKLTL